MAPMLDTCFAEFNPIIEVLAIKLNAPVAPHTWNRALGDQVAERGGAAPDVIGRGAFVSGRLLSATTPGREFQVATRRSGGQAAISSASSFSLAEESKGVCVAAAASSAVANALMLFSLSIVNVILNLLGAALCAVIT